MTRLYAWLLYLMLNHNTCAVLAGALALSIALDAQKAPDLAELLRLSP